jgi:hypothetical protein
VRRAQAAALGAVHRQRLRALAVVVTEQVAQPVDRQHRRLVDRARRLG